MILNSFLNAKEDEKDDESIEMPLLLIEEERKEDDISDFIQNMSGIQPADQDYTQPMDLI
jgi:hypothetical protein